MSFLSSENEGECGGKVMGLFIFVVFLGGVTYSEASLAPYAAFLMAKATSKMRTLLLSHLTLC